VDRHQKPTPRFPEFGAPFFLSASNIRDLYRPRPHPDLASRPPRQAYSSSYKSRQVGLSVSISSIFQSRNQRFMRYSRRWADSADGCGSK